MSATFTPGFGRHRSAELGILYESVLGNLAASRIIVPAADPRYGALSAATFLTTGDARIVVTPDDPLQDWTIPPGIAGIVPTIDFGGQASSGDLLSVAANAAIEDIWDGGGVAGCWVNLRSDGASDLGRLVAKSDWQLYVGSESAGSVKVTFGQTFSGDDGGWITDATDLTLNGWHLVVVEYDSDAVGNNPVISIDTVASAITESTTPVGTRDSDTGVDMIVGNLAAATRTLDGRMAGGPLGFFTKDGTWTADEHARYYELGRAALALAA